MKKFTSRLQSLQRVKEQQEKLARARLADCRRQCEVADQHRDQIQQSLAATSQNVHTLLTTQPGAELVHGSRALYHSQQSQLAFAELQRMAAEAAAHHALEQWNSTRASLEGINQRIDRQRAEHRRQGFLQEEHRQQERTVQTRHQQQSENSEGTQS